MSSSFLTNEERKELLSLYREPPKEEKKVEKKPFKKIFISYVDKPDNDNLVENLIRNFLKKLDFYPRTWRDARSSVPLKAEIDRLIEESPILIAFLTKDIPEHAS